jgi:hypothetical protein
MNRMAPLVGIALVTAVLLVPTGAVPFGTDAVNEDLVMAPAEGPNGDYAILNEDEEIELLLTGANPSVDGDGLDANAITPLSRVFTITYTGDGTAEVWLTDDSEDVRFYRGDDTDDSLEGEDNSVTLEPSESLAVGLLVDTRGDHDVESADTFTVHAEESGTDDDDDGDTDDAGDNDDGDDDDASADSDTDDAGDNDDTRVETPTPAPPAETGQVASPSSGQGETDGTSTPTVTVEPGGGPPAVNESGQSPDSGGGPPPDTGGEPIELGGIELGPLLTIAAIMISLPSGLAAYRWYN